MICSIIKKTFDTRLDVKGSNSYIFENQSHHQEDFRHRNFWGCTSALGVSYFECHTYNYLDNGEHALVLPKWETRTIILGQREYVLGSLTLKLKGWLLIARPHLLVRTTSERFPPAKATFRSVLASESHWLQPLLVLTVRWWTGTSKCGRAITHNHPPCSW